MTEPIPLEWLLELPGARALDGVSGTAASVCTDSRQATPGALFFALPGERTDGHAHVAQAFARGAVAAVVAHEVEGAGEPQIVVPDTVQALGDLAMRHRARFTIPLIGITGSVGKTSTKEMIAAILGAHYPTLANERNLNTEIGVPLTLFRLESAYRAAVIEMGMRGLRQIDRLAEIARPTIGLITSIGHSHVELLGSRERIAQAKAELLARLPSDGIAVLPRHSPFFDFLRDRTPPSCRLITFTTLADTAADVSVAYAEDTSGSDSGCAFDLKIRGRTHRVRLALPGVHHGENAAAAMAVALAFEVDPEAAVDALERWQGAEGRMAVRHVPDGVTLLDDCYNASVESMSAALRTLYSLSGQQHPGVAVLGDMRELGDFGAAAHRLVGAEAASGDLRLLVTVGEAAAGIAQAMNIARAEREVPPASVRAYSDAAEAASHIRELILPGDVVLVKGSRALRMEQIVAALTGEPLESPHG